jgi:transposase
MDLSSLFRSVIKSSFPNAKIIADKFHTCRLANWALESVVNGNIKVSQKDG